MVYLVGSILSRLLGFLGFAPSLWIIANYVLGLVGNGVGRTVESSDALAFAGLGLLSLLFLIPSLERPLIRSSSNRFYDIVKNLVVVPASALLVIAGTSGLLIIDVVAESGRSVLFAAMGLLWLSFLYLAVFPGAYARELDFRAGSDGRGLTRTARHIKARLSFDAAVHGPTLRPEEPQPRDWGRSLLMALLTSFLAAVVIAFYGSRLAFFLPDYAVVAYLEQKALVAAAIIAQLTVVLVLVARTLPGHVLLRSRPVEAIALASVMGFFTYFASGQSLGTGLPAVHSLIFPGSSTKMAVDVVERGREDVSLGCGHIAYVRPADWPDNRQVRVCEVPFNLWQTLEPGQRLVLTGNRTEFGLRYEEIDRLP